ncbi:MULTISPECIES: protein-disulfide reductase DsbD [Aliivibrio]|uniref:Thiol:disulfide interchange protein DsbD n=1 Tax=Aliivibrio finisterrensis TaxID=511998 RepID=A0A4Q5KSN4_9GAMM|nr:MULTISPECIES: protein-disulfide reductase DsbD [Aliivibrio]MDD9179709.1 protein-disulfide reductase DsbD [Aliivibrio sp. A6]RYU50554.1 protein-disulfide reductase DsbD [Aliivibrio finisterrensis]RYU52174.1 protein-disulfide reductase DsbD [Aliivibrio finisterrensis]RYU57236.1 protein-disulfide reductase DsbD [Aliivibrio finisterrensis]RYU63647.1 protein-disulfide reductase DsbD [Aliivibrio finisterrensis]
MTNLLRFRAALLSFFILFTSFVPQAVASFDLTKLQGKQTSSFVTVNEAFPFNFMQQGDRVYLDWQVMPDYYLYQQRISVTANGAKIADLVMEEGTPYTDEFFGDVNIYTEPLTITVPLISVSDNAELTVRYQGCAKAGFCYPPEIRKIPLSALTGLSSYQDETANTHAVAKNDNAPVGVEKKTSSNSEQKEVSQTQQQELADNLGDAWWTPFLFLALGIGLAFTPCVLPMYPILTGIVLGGGKLSHGKAFKLSFVYVQGMALTYTLLGLVVASAGLQFQAALQHPYVLIGLSIMFVLLALSMFGAYTIQLPSNLQTKLNDISNQQKGGNLGGVFAMGAISGLVCSPCTTAPLSGALLYVAKSGDLLTGAVALYALAIGMGIPLILAAVFGNKLLPKAGVWMTHVKTLFGFILLAVPVFLLERILPHNVTPFVWSALGVAAFGWLYHVKATMPQSWKTSVAGIIAILGIVGSAIPVIDAISGKAHTEINTTTQTVTFKKIANLEDLNRELEAAKAQGKSVMLDFYADWCVACKEFEKYTFHNEKVEPLLGQFILLQADVTKNSPEDIALLQQLKVLGLPTIDFWNANGDYLSNARLTGFMKAEPFMNHLQQSVSSVK